MNTQINYEFFEFPQSGVQNFSTPRSRNTSLLISYYNLDIPVLIGACLMMDEDSDKPKFRSVNKLLLKSAALQNLCNDIMKDYLKCKRDSDFEAIDDFEENV